MTALWHESDGQWSLLEPVGFPDEATLRDLVFKKPELLPLSGSPQVAALGREVPLGGGYADILAIEASGRPVVIEVKLGQNSEARRAVVSQALAYASSLDGLSAEELERSVIGRQLREQGFETISDCVTASDQEGAFDSDEFEAGLTEALAAGRFRVVLVLDRAPQELVRLTGYLEKVTSDLTIDLVTVSSYAVGDSKVVVPQRVDPERPPSDTTPEPSHARRPRGELTDGADRFAASIDETGDDAALLHKLVSWAKQLDEDGLVHLHSFEGTSGRFTLLPRLWKDTAGLVTIWNDKGASISLWRSVFERRAPSAIPEIERITGTRMGTGSSAGAITDELLDALYAAYQAAGTAEQP